MRTNVTLRMNNYIAHPFWSARNTVIEIEKKSGVNRQRSEDKRIAALKAQCEKMGLTYEDYLRLKEEAAEQWYRDRNGNIIIPRHQIAGGLVQTIGTAPKALRGGFSRDNFRALVQIGDFVTDRKKADGVFARFVKLETSNQRSFQENEFIGQYIQGDPFTAVGAIAFDDRQEQTVKAVFSSLLANTGIGAARKMGFGRGQIAKWESE